MEQAFERIDEEQHGAPGGHLPGSGLNVDLVGQVTVSGANNKYVVGTDEDFSPSRLSFEITDGPNAGFYGGGQFGWTVPISASNPFTGSTVWGGTGYVRTSTATGPATGRRSRRSRAPELTSSSSPAAPASS